MLATAPRALAVPCEDSFTDTLGSAWNEPVNWSTGQVPTVMQDVCLGGGSRVVIGAGVGAQAATLTGTLVSGSLEGTGTIQPRFINEGGEVEPGGKGEVGTLDFGSEYAQDEGAQLDLDLASDGSFDRLQPAATADALIYGRIAVQALGSYAPAVGTTWDFISGIGGVSKGWTVTPGEFSASSISGGARLRLDSALPGETGGETPPDEGGEEVPGKGGGEAPGGSGSPGTAPADSTPAPGSQAEEALLRGCTPGPLWLTDVYLKGSRVYVSGAAPRVTAGQAVRIVRFHRTVATTKVGADGTFRVLAKAPPARFRRSSWYAAVINGLRSPAIPLSQRLVLEAPRRVGRRVVISGAAPRPRVAWPRPVTVTAQTECGVQVKVRTFKPQRRGRFRITIPAPATDGVTVYQLSSGSDLSFAVPLVHAG